jgi:hypothetical protein
MNQRIRTIIIIIYFFVGITAIGGGAALMWAPDGSLLKMPLSDLSPSPFKDYFLPGLILFTIMGVGSFRMAYLFRKGRYRLSTLLIISGTMVNGWILTQMVMIQKLHGLQFLYLAIGVYFLFVGSRDRYTAN